MTGCWVTCNGVGSEGWIRGCHNDLGLLTDCMLLLGAEDGLVPDIFVSCCFCTPLKQWGGVVLGGYPQRIVDLRLDRVLEGWPERESKGPELAKLERLDLRYNRSAGSIPEQLGRLTALKRLELGED